MKTVSLEQKLCPDEKFQASARVVSRRADKENVMRKLFKKLSILSVAAVLAAGTLSFAACGGTVTVAPDNSATAQTATENGGFVAATADYYYFINGVETHTADNTYGKVVKGALMRAKKADVQKKENNAEIVIPSLISSSDYTSGIYIYGEGANARVYYATPNNVKNTSGQIETDILDFKSAKLDGSDVKTYFRVSDNATVFRFVNVENTVYVLYVENNNLHSYNTATDTDTELATSMSAYVLNSNDKTDPYVYYTMPVKGWIDTTNGGTDYKFNQIYRVRADATQPAHDFKLDQDWIKNENDGKEPYHNLGRIVLDGIGEVENFDPRFSPDYDDTVKLDTMGYTYTLQAYANDGIYFTRSRINSSSEGLFYLAEEKITDGWNSINGNSVYGSREPASAAGHLEVVASSVNASNAGTAAIFYIELGENNVKHHYLYVNGSSIYRADVINDGMGLNVQYGSTGASGDLEIAYDASGATLIARDAVSDNAYDYVYYTKSSGSGTSVERVPYSGDVDDYSNLIFGDDDHANDAYKAVKLDAVEHASGWYNYEIVDNILFYANSQAIGSTSYNYVYAVDLKNAHGTLKNNVELEADNDLYDLVMGDEGYLAKVTEDYSNLSNPIKYYFYTGKSEQFWTNIQEAEALGKSPTYLYKEDEKAIFKAFTEGDNNDFVAELNGDGVKYRTQSAFITFLGKRSEADEKSEADYWKTALANYQKPEEEGGLAWWAWMLIGISIFVVVAGAAGLTVYLVLRKKKTAEQKPVHKLAVDTSDDKDIDVYAVNDGGEEAPVTEEPAEVASEETEEEPAKELAEETAAEEAPASDEPAAEEVAQESEPEQGDGQKE